MKFKLLTSIIIFSLIYLFSFYFMSKISFYIFGQIPIHASSFLGASKPEAIYFLKRCAGGPHVIRFIVISGLMLFNYFILFLWFYFNPNFPANNFDKWTQVILFSSIVLSLFAVGDTIFSWYSLSNLDIYKLASSTQHPMQFFDFLAKINSLGKYECFLYGFISLLNLNFLIHLWNILNVGIQRVD